MFACHLSVPANDHVPRASCVVVLVRIDSSFLRSRRARDPGERCHRPPTRRRSASPLSSFSTKRPAGSAQRAHPLRKTSRQVTRVMDDSAGGRQGLRTPTRPSVPVKVTRSRSPKPAHRDHRKRSTAITQTGSSRSMVRPIGAIPLSCSEGPSRLDAQVSVGRAMRRGRCLHSAPEGARALASTRSLSLAQRGATRGGPGGFGFSELWSRCPSRPAPRRATAWSSAASGPSGPRRGSTETGSGSPCAGAP